MRIRENLTIVLAVVALGLAVAQMIRPFGLRVQPGILIFIALLLGLRYAMYRQARKRAESLKNIPKRPLGLQ